MPFGVETLRKAKVVMAEQFRQRAKMPSRQFQQAFVVDKRAMAVIARNHIEQVRFLHAEAAPVLSADLNRHTRFLVLRQPIGHIGTPDRAGFRCPRAKDVAVDHRAAPSALLPEGWTWRAGLPYSLPRPVSHSITAIHDNSMNSYQAKRIPLKAILTALGCSPAKEARGEIWYASPFRAESEASFKINEERNIWYDFGLGEGGNVIDFARTYFRTGTVAGALEELEHLMGAARPLFPSPPSQARPAASREAPAPDMEITSIGPLASRALIEYLRSRAIPPELARNHLQEMHYRRGGKAYFGLAFANRSGGFELRNPYFKGSHGRKDISLIAFPAETAESLHVAVFEGFTDFLSALAHHAVTPDMPCIVLNSAALGDRAIELLRGLPVQQLDLYFDHDDTGRKLTDSFRQALTGCPVIDQSALYAGYKDFNAFLTDRRNHRAAP